MHLMHSLFAGTTQSVTAIRFQGELDGGVLVQAVIQVMAEHEVFRMDIVERDDAFWFARRDDHEPPVRRLRAASGNEWRRVFVDECNRPLPTSGVLWRATVLETAAVGEPVYDLVLTFHHAAIDGMGMEFLLEALVERAARPKALSRPMPLGPASEPLAATIQSQSAFEALQSKLARQFAAISPMPHRSKVPVAERTTEAIFFRTRRDRLAAPRGDRNESRATFNAIASAALLRAVHEHSGGRQRFAFGTAFSLRRLCPTISDADLGCHIAVVFTFHDSSREPPGLFDLAESYRMALAKAILVQARLPPQTSVGQMRAGLAPLGSISHFVHDIGFTAPHSSGRLRSDTGLVRVVHLYGGVNRALANLAIVAHALAVGDEIFITINYVSQVQDSAWVKAVSDQFRELVHGEYS
jgi:hypothetical protein